MDFPWGEYPDVVEDPAGVRGRRFTININNDTGGFVGGGDDEPGVNKDTDEKAIDNHVLRNQYMTFHIEKALRTAV